MILKKCNKLSNLFLRTKKFKIGFVPQYGGYFHDLTLRENLKSNCRNSLINNVSYRNEKINLLISKFELDAVRNIKANFYLVDKKKISYCFALMSRSKNSYLLDEPFCSFRCNDNKKSLQEIIVDLQSNNNISIILCDHQARDLLACVDTSNNS